jgi:hypothetical protein
MAKTHPERIVQKDGKLFYVQSEAPPAAGETEPPANTAAPQ